MRKYRVYLVVVFKNCFMFLKTKKIENVFGKGGDFCFWCFPCSRKASFQRTKKKTFWLFSSLLKEELFSLFSSPVFCVSLHVFLLQQQEMKRMQMAAMLADYGGVGVSEWLWVWKASASPMVVRYDSTKSYPPWHWSHQVWC